MITFDIPETLDLCSSVLSNEQVWAECGFDDIPAPESIEPNGRDLYLEVYHDGTFIGYVCLSPWTSTTIEVHTAILPEHRGRAVTEAGLELINWLKTYTHYTKAICRVSKHNVKAYAAARRAGFSIEGKLSGTYKKNGKFWDELLLGVNLWQ